MSKAPTPAIVSRVNVSEVYDGDTLTVELVRKVKLRLLDCWCPEIRTRNLDEKHRGLAAREHLQEIVKNGSDFLVEVPTEHADSVDDVLTFGRVLGYLYVDGQNVSELMVVAGHATKTKEG